MALVMRRTGWRGEAVGAVTGAAVFLVVSVVDTELRAPIAVTRHLHSSGCCW